MSCTIAICELPTVMLARYSISAISPVRYGMATSRIYRLERFLEDEVDQLIRDIEKRAKYQRSFEMLPRSALTSPSSSKRISETTLTLVDSSVDKPYTVKPLKRSPSLKNSDNLSSNRHYFTLHQTLGRNHPDPPSRNYAISWPNQEKDDAD